MIAARALLSCGGLRRCARREFFYPLRRTSVLLQDDWRFGLKRDMHMGGHGGSLEKMEKMDWNAPNMDAISPEDREKQEKITWVGLWSNVGLSAIKLVVGVESGSVSLIADAFHSASDLCGDFVALAALNLARKPPDEVHPYGYGHYESLGTLLVSALLITGGGAIGYHSFDQLFLVAENGGESMISMYPAALGIIGVSVVVKEWLYRVTVDIGKRTRSPVLVANAWHHRTDAFSSFVALVGIAGAALGMPYLDPVAGLLVSGMVLKAGADVGWEAVQDLTDRKRDSDGTLIRGVYEIARKMAEQPGSGIIDVHEVRIRRLGHYVLLDFHLRVDPRLSVTGGYFEKNRIKRKIYRAFPAVGEIFIHVQAHPSKTQSFTSNNFDSTESQYGLGRRTISGFGKDLSDRTHSIGKSDVPKTLRSPFVIEQDVTAVVEKCMELDPVILGLSHSLVHYNVASVPHPVVNIEVNLRMSKDISLSRADRAAQLVREKILQIPDVDMVDIHLELLEG